MGKAVEAVALQRQHKITAVFDIDKNICEQSNLKSLGDVAIEFSTPNTAMSNVFHCINNALPVVCGTTGWDVDCQLIKQMCNEHKTAMFYASNYSIGMNIFMQINRQLAEKLQKYADYKVNIDETHHIHKLDKPSGTAITLAKDIIANNSNYCKWQLDQNGDNIVGINSFREGEIFGNHSVHWENACDEITISHSAKNRTGLALGAVLAAEFIANKQGMFSMNDLLQIK